MTDRAFSHHAANLLIWEWALEELGEIRRDEWFAAVAAGFADYVPGYRELVDHSDRGYRINRTGWTIMTLRRVHRLAIRRYYLSGETPKRRALRAALDAFVQAWPTYDAVFEPLNSDQMLDNFLPPP